MFVGNDVTAARATRARRSIPTGCGISARTSHATHGAHAATRATGTAGSNESAARSHKTPAAFSSAARAHIRIIDALSRHANLSFGTNGAGARVLARAIGVAIFTDGARLSDARIDEAPAIGLTRQTRPAFYTGTVIGAHAIDTYLARVARNGSARIHAGADATNLTVRTNDTIARPDAIAFFAFLPRGTLDRCAQDVDAQTIGIAHFTRTTYEFAAIAFRYARAFVADFARVTKVAFVGRAITIVIESVAFFPRGLIRLHTRERPILALHRSIGANALLARVARSSTTRTRDSSDERREVIEIIVPAGEQIFPSEIKCIRCDRAVVDDQVDEGIRLVPIGIVLLFAVENVYVVPGRGTIGHTFVKPDCSAEIVRVIFDVERFGNAQTVVTLQELV